MFFSIPTKNWNWEILTKNLVIFKRWDGVKNERCYYFGGSLKNPIFRWRVREKPTYRGDSLNRGAWTVCRFKGELGEKERVVFMKGVDTPVRPTPTPKNSEQKLKYLEMKRAFKVKQKVFFIFCKRLSVARNCFRRGSAPLSAFVVKCRKIRL